MSVALENVGRLAEWGKRHGGADAASGVVSPIASVGIIGAGVMGAAIAAAHVRHRLPVILSDIDPEKLDRVPAAVAAELASYSDSAVGQESPRHGDDRLETLVRTTTSAVEAARCDLVLEAIVETLPAKQRLFEQLREHLDGCRILASNTSTIPLQRLARGAAEPSRFCGLHFLHPVPQRPLVEIVRGAWTSADTIATAVAHVRRIGRMTIVVEDGPGFVVNRLLFPYLSAGLELLSEGVPAEAIDATAVAFGMALGPLHLMDEIGLDTTLQAGWVLATAFPERVAPSPLLVSMIKAGRLGRKSGAGFFAYPAASSVETEIPHVAMPNERLAHRLILPMLLEATRILEEGKVRDVRAIDLAAVFGLGFPAQEGGLLWWADAIGLDNIRSRLQSFHDHGGLYRPTPMVEGLASSGGRFYRRELLR
jgi:3-hydroxyacyl-CoA dehydrogenase